MPKDELQNYYITFGFGSPLRDYYWKIVTNSESTARKEVTRCFGNHWANIYNEREWTREDKAQNAGVTQAELYNLKLLKETVIPYTHEE